MTMNDFIKLHGKEAVHAFGRLRIVLFESPAPEPARIYETYHALIMEILSIGGFTEKITGLIDVQKATEAVAQALSEKQLDNALTALENRRNVEHLGDHP